MKKIYLLLIFIITACSTAELGADNQNCLGIRKFKVLQALYHNAALAYECNTFDCSSYYNNNLDMILGDDVNEDLYDGMIYKVPTDKCAVRDGVYRYKNKQGDTKTVSQIVFEYKNNPATEKEQQYRYYKAKENIFYICMRDFENEKIENEKYCTCFAKSYFNNHGDRKAIKKECKKLPKFMEGSNE